MSLLYVALLVFLFGIRVRRFFIGALPNGSASVYSMDRCDRRSPDAGDDQELRPVDARVATKSEASDNSSFDQVTFNYL